MHDLPPQGRVAGGRATTKHSRADGTEGGVACHPGDPALCVGTGPGVPALTSDTRLTCFLLPLALLLHGSLRVTDVCGLRPLLGTVCGRGWLTPPRLFLERGLGTLLAAEPP